MLGSYLGRQNADTAVQGGYIGVALDRHAECGLRHAADIALLCLHSGHIRVQAYDVAISLQVTLNPHKQQPPKHGCEGQVCACIGASIPLLGFISVVSMTSKLAVCITNVELSM